MLVTTLSVEAWTGTDSDGGEGAGAVGPELQLNSRCIASSLQGLLQ